MDDARRVVWMPGGVRTEIHLDRVDTQGAFCLLVDDPPAGWSLPPHVHHGVAETIHVTADKVHASANVGAAPGRRIVMFSPAGMEEFFLEAGAPSREVEVDGSNVLAAAVRQGWEFVAGPGDQ